ncbi:unnamed protein product [Ostreobium quekettii]|uniref:S1 motif domain-containing protein n=1 Tax=Ostreobium quekettii TaxID=121088 RepID=A0A8S1ISG5_9CHLO|nr:unnamed protein product [Ostreobium quekettii]
MRPAAQPRALPASGRPPLLSTPPPPPGRAPAHENLRFPNQRRLLHGRASAVAEPTAEELEFLDDDLDVNSDELYKEFDALLSESKPRAQVGDVVSGLVFAVDQKGAYVDYGQKEVGFVPVSEVSLAEVKNVSDVLSEDDVREFEIISSSRAREFAGGCNIMSLKKLELNVAWQRLRQLQENDVVTTAHLVSANKGGYIVSVLGVPGFLPGSHLSNPSLKSTDLLDTERPVKLLDVDEATNRVVVSNRVYVGGNKDEFKVGTVVLGTVTNIKPFGAFVEVGNGVVGLLHVSQITHGRVADITKVFSEGDRLKVMVLSYDRVRRRVSLSTKKLEATPGDMLKDPALVYSKADEMAERFRQQVAEAEAKAKAEEERLASQSRMEPVMEMEQST